MTMVDKSSFYTFAKESYLNHTMTRFNCFSEWITYELSSTMKIYSIFGQVIAIVALWGDECLSLPICFSAFPQFFKASQFLQMWENEQLSWEEVKRNRKTQWSHQWVQENGGPWIYSLRWGSKHTYYCRRLGIYTNLEKVFCKESKGSTSFLQHLEMVQRFPNCRMSISHGLRRYPTI